MDDLDEFISKEDLSKEQVYNAEETDLFWKALPRSTLVDCSETTVEASEISKDRLTVLVCSNAAGTLLVLFLVLSKA